MFPVLYHSHHNPYQEDIPFWSALAEETQDPVLELGCGTGRVLTHLIQDQRHVYGLDNDLEMLTFLYEQLQPDLEFGVGEVQGRAETDRYLPTGK